MAFATVLGYLQTQEAQTLRTATGLRRPWAEFPQRVAGVGKWDFHMPYFEKLEGRRS